MFKTLIRLFRELDKYIYDKTEKDEFFNNVWDIVMMYSYVNGVLSTFILMLIYVITYPIFYIIEAIKKSVK